MSARFCTVRVASEETEKERRRERKKERKKERNEIERESESEKMRKSWIRIERERCRNMDRLNKELD